MGMPITTDAGGICFGFPNVCRTQVGPSQVPIPYPSIGQLSEAKETSDDVEAAGSKVVVVGSYIEKSSGDEAALPDSGVKSSKQGGKVEFKSGSGSVLVNGKKVVRLLDQTSQNEGNCIGVVLGGEPSVLVGD